VLLTPVTIQNKTLENTEGAIKMGTQDKDRPGKNTTQYVLDITIHKQTQTT